MKSIVVHAGLPKTGTSAVQAWLAANAERLQAAGVYYPWHAVDDNQVSAGNAGYVLAPGTWSVDSALVEETMEEFETSGCDTLLLSSEAFMPELESLSRALPAQTRFVLYVRDPLEFLESDYNQRVKRLPHLAEFVPDAAAYGGWLGHEYLYGALDSGIDRRQLDLRPYHPTLFTGGNLLTDLLSTLGVDPVRLGDTSLRRVNTSYSLHALEMKRALNHLPLGDALAERLDSCLQSCPLGPTSYTLIPPDARERLRRQADDELRALSLRYDIDSLEPLRKALLEQPTKPYYPQLLSSTEIDLVADHLGRTAFRLVARLAMLLEQHPEIELPYPSLRAAIMRADALDREEPAAAAPPKRKWWQLLHA